MSNIQVQTRNGSLSESAREKIAAKLEKLGRFEERVSGIDVIVDLATADMPRVEVIVTTELKHTFRADFTSGDLYGCVDQCSDKVAQQMRRFKEKLTDHRVKDNPKA